MKFNMAARYKFVVKAVKCLPTDGCFTACKFLSSNGIISRTFTPSKPSRDRQSFPPCRFKPYSNKVNGDEGGKLIELVVTSLRVDRVVASGLGIARRKVELSLLVGNIFLNGKKVTKKSTQVVDGDIIERISDTQPTKEKIKFGQVKIVCIGDLTKKGNFHIEILRNKSLLLPIEEFWNTHKS